MEQNQVLKGSFTGHGKRMVCLHPSTIPLIDVPFLPYGRFIQVSEELFSAHGGELP